MTTLEMLQRFSGIGEDFGRALKRLKNRKEAYKVLTEKLKYSHEDAKRYAQHLSPKEILTLELQANLNRAKTEQQQTQESEQSKLLESAGENPLAALTKSKELRDYLTYRPSFYEAPGATVKEYTGFGGPARLPEPKLERDEQGNPTGVSFYNPKNPSEPIFQTPEQVGAAAMAYLEDIQPGKNKRIIPPQAQVDVSPEEQKGRPSFESFKQGAQNLGKIVGPGIVGGISQALGVKGDIAQLGLNAAESLSPYPEMSPEQLESRRNYFLNLAKERPQDKSFYESLASQKPVNPYEAISAIMPTKENIQNLIGFGGEKAGIGEYVTPSTPEAKTAQEIGETAGLLIRPYSALTGSTGLLPRAAEATAAATGLRAAGHAAEKATGSKTFGKGVELVGGLGYAMFPGTFSAQSKNIYNQFDKVIEGAEKEGKMIDLTAARDDFNKISRKIDQLNHGTDTYKTLKNHAQGLEAMVKGGKTTPSALSDSYKSMSNATDSLDTAIGKKYLGEMINLQKNTLKNFADNIVPGSSQLLTNADSIHRAGAELSKELFELKSILNIKNFSIGVPIFMMGGYKPLAVLGATKMAGTYINRLASVPAIQDTMGHLFKAAGKKNIALTNRLAHRLDKQVDKEISHWPQYDKERIKTIAEEVKKKELEESSAYMKKKKR